MTTTQVILLVVGICVVLPPLTYVVSKMATAGYLRAKERHKQKQTNLLANEKR